MARRYFAALLWRIAERFAGERRLPDSLPQRDLARIFRAAHIGSWQFEIGKTNCEYSDEFRQICGLDCSEAPLQRIFEIIHVRDRWRAAYVFRRSLRNGRSYNIQLRIVRRDGSVRYVQCAGDAVLDYSGVPRKLVGTLLDVTNSRRIMELTQLRSRLVTLNRIGQEMSMALSREQLIRRAVMGLRHELGYPGALIALKDQAGHSGQSPGGQTADPASEYAIRPHAVPIQIGRRAIGIIVVPICQWTSIDQELLEMFAAHIAVAIQNIQLFEKIRNIASMDPLTGIFNRRQVLELAQHEIARHRRHKLPMAVIAFDVDYFKQINDRHGHATGDEVLRLVARRAKECIRKTDLLARYGGDEFVIFLPDTGLGPAEEIAERLRATIQYSTLIIKGTCVSFTVSVGLACSRGEPDLSALVEQADQALYAAKHAGRNFVCAATHDN